MDYLTLGLCLFFTLHSLRIVAPHVRESLIQRLGIPVWYVLHGGLSLVSLWLIASGYAMERLSPTWLWFPPMWLNHLTLLIMLVAMIFLWAGLIKGTYIRRLSGAPVPFALVLWALAHMLSNPTVADMVLFGSFLVWATVLKRDVLTRSPVAESPSVRRTLAAVGLGIISFTAIAFWGHEYLIGVNPIAGMV